MTSISPQQEVLCLGETEIGGTLDGVTDESGRRLSVRTTSVAALSDQPGDVDCLLVDTTAVDSWEAATDSIDQQVPVVVLQPAPDVTDRVDTENGVADILPRSLCRTHPELVATRLTSLAESPRRPLDGRTRELFENVADGLVLHDPDTGTIVDVNERFCELNGYSREQLVGEDIDFVTAPEYDYAEAAAHIQQAHEEGSQLFEWRNEHRNGETFPVEVHLSVVEIDGIEYVLASVRDITEQKRREREFEEIFNGVQDAIIVMDPDSLDILEANEAYLDLVGYENLEAIQDQGIDGLSATTEGYTVEEGREVHQRVAETGDPEVVEWQAETSSGERRWLEVKIAPARIGGDRVHVASHRDITARKRREREFEEIFNGVHNPITVHDIETAQIREVNDAFCELLGYSRAEILDMGVEGYSHTESGNTIEEGRKFVKEVIESGEPQRTEWVVETSDGERRWLDVEGTTVEIDGERQYVSISRDITEQKRREREYEQIFNGVNDLVAVHDPETGELLDVNDTFVDVTGYDRETLFDIGAEGVTVDTETFSTDQIPHIIDRVIEGDDVDPYVQAIETADGQRRWLEVNPTRAVIDGEQRFLAISRDVTERRERQQRLARERDRREALFENNPDPVLRLEFVDGKPVIREVNPAFERIFGYDPDAVVGSTVGETLVPESEREEYDRFREAVANGETIDGEAPRETVDGLRQFAFTVIQFTIAESETDAYVWYTDVTERRRREQAIRTLQESTERMQRAATAGEIAEIAVDAAQDALDLPVTMCWLHDDDQLVPAAATAAGRDWLPEDPLGPGSDEYEVFEQGTVTPCSETATMPGGGLLLPLGDHGLLAAGREGAATDDLSTDVARTLTEQTTTALDRIERAREVRESERRLQAIIDRIDEAIFLAPAPDLNDASPAPDFVSSGYEDIWGQPLEDVHDTYEEGFFGTLHPDDYDGYRAFLDGIIADIEDGTPEERYTTEYRIEQPDGEVRWVQSDYYPTDLGEEVPRVLIVSRDITHRKERTRRLESFHDATAELTTADSVEAASRIAVEAAADVFDLPATAVYRYDSDRATLDPTATGPDVPGASEFPPLTADDTAVWDAFVDEQLHRVPVSNSSPLAVGAGEELLLFPLGGNGLLVVWQSDEEFDTDAASILAATLEAALNRLRGERQLESRREELQAQTERAQRLDAIAEVTQRVEAAITGNSSRQGIQEAVCAELVDVEPFTGAWVGTAEVGTDRLTPRTVAGVERDHVEQALTRADQSDPHPATQAWQTGESRVVNDLVGSGRRSEWRQVLLKAGAGSVCAVPLTYGGVTYGVLTIIADEPGEFGERAQDVLSQLSRSIGYALTAIERQRALESDDTLELEFEATDIDLPVADLADQLNCRAHYERTVRRTDGSVSVYYSLLGDLPGEVADAARTALPGEVTVVSQQDGEVIIERQGSSWFGSLIAEYGGVLRRCRATPERVTLVVELPQETTTRTIVERLQEEFPSLELTAQRQHRESELTPGEVQNRLQQRLSDRQYEALETAHVMGYFDWPRESSGEDVADQLGITQPTVNKHLRLAEKKVFDILLESE